MTAGDWTGTPAMLSCYIHGIPLGQVCWACNTAPQSFGGIQWTVPSPVQSGWQCPACSRVMSPVMPFCLFCSAATLTTGGASAVTEWNADTPMSPYAEQGEIQSVTLSGDWKTIFPGRLQARYPLAGSNEPSRVVVEFRRTPQPPGYT